MPAPPDKRSGRLGQPAASENLTLRSGHSIPGPADRFRNTAAPRGRWAP
jgi:hypothetical protein